MTHDPGTALVVPKKKPARKKFYTPTGAVNEGKLTLKDIVLAPEVPSGGKDSKYFESRCETLSIRALVESGAAEYILARPNHPAFVRVLEFVTERSRGKVPDIIKNEHVINPAVALPAKNAEVITYVESEVVSDGTTDPVATPPRAAE